jgi:hypothetical protein
VRGLPSPFINLDERGRETPHTSFLPLLPQRKDFLDEADAALRTVVEVMLIPISATFPQLLQALKMPPVRGVAAEP